MKKYLFRTIGVRYLALTLSLMTLLVFNLSAQPTLTIEPENLNFGEVVIGSESILSYTLTGSNLNAPVRIHSSMGFLVSAEENVPFRPHLILEPEEGEINQSIRVKFQPLTPREFSGRIQHHTVGVMGLPLQLSGVGIIDEDVTPPTLTVNPELLEFGEVAIGESVVMSYTLTGSNLQSPVMIHSAPGFMLSLDEETSYLNMMRLLPDDGELEATIYVRFTPIVPRDFRGLITHRGRGIQNVRVALSGVGTGETQGPPSVELSTEALDFGDVFIGEYQTLSYDVITSNLIRPLRIFSSPGFLLSLEEDGEFRRNLLIEPIQEEATRTVFVRFNARYPRHIRGRIIHNTPRSRPVFLLVEGTGIIPETEEQRLSLDVPFVQATELKGNYPNPFNPETSINFVLNSPEWVELDIFDISGRQIRNLVNGNFGAGVHNIVWDGRDNQGRQAGSGVYFYRMKSGSYTSTKKMLLMK